MNNIFQQIQKLRKEYLELKEKEKNTYKNPEEWSKLKNQLQEKWRDMETLHILLEEGRKQKF